MSRVAKVPVGLPPGVEATVSSEAVRVKGAKGELTLRLGRGISVAQQDRQLVVTAGPGSPLGRIGAGTMRAQLANMVTGVTRGFERKLELVGVGYRAAAAGKKLNLTLGFSHPVEYDVPEGITIDTPTQTEIVVKGADKQQVGQVAAEIRSYRPPEPYKGKGVRYSGERIELKETKKK